ncbi:papilin isoform X2 [Planococcus citri]|uniref:papilin isoform X2 n=1 Tax=Planococcus citri TaxID=170843 RepID=UPI0031F72CF3
MDVFKYHPRWLLLLIFSWTIGHNSEADAATAEFNSPPHAHRHHHSLIPRFGTRHRRQHTINADIEYYYFESEAFPSSEEYGIWSNWTAGAECTRSCGGGVAYQIRQCLSVGSNGYPNCRGAAKRYFSCNIYDCPDVVDFRAEQCSKFDSVPFDKYFYTWVPYTKGQNKCELNCMPRGERFYYRHKKQVIDGTTCDDERPDICVNGRCVPIGCDRLLGSPLREDKCRICGGDGSSCQTIASLVTRNDLQVGYNDLMLIPAGAMNIRIRQLRYSNNYLAVRNLTNHYYLNGGWRIDIPKSFRFAGTIFHYERIRDTLGFLAIESISALGPITESLYIVVLYQEKNADIEYEYSLTNGTIIYTGEPYQWWYDEFSNCSSTCGGGYKARKVWCAKTSDRTANVSDNLCDPGLEPIRNQTCAQDACAPQWVVGEWSKCSHICGNNGTQNRTIKCEQKLGNGKSTSVDSNLCETSDEQKPNTTQPCNVGIQCPQWYVGPWKACDKLCGDGFQRREIKCYYKLNGKINITEDAACSGPKPESEKPCFVRPCEGVDWITTEWSDCKDKCDVTFETRSAVCSTAKGKAYPDKYCKKSKQPILIKECNTSSACEYQWYATQWSECSSTCGAGLQSRKVFCGFLQNDTIQKTNDSKCDISKKYEATQICSGKAQCDGEWFHGPWSACSKTCGGGSKNRTVLCMLGNKTADVTKCNLDKILFKTETCNNQACGSDEIIPVVSTGTVSENTPEEEECEENEKDYVVTVPSNMDSKSMFTMSDDVTTDDSVIKFFTQTDSSSDDGMSSATEFTPSDQSSAGTDDTASTSSSDITITETTSVTITSESSSSSSGTSSSIDTTSSSLETKTTMAEENTSISSSSTAPDTTASDTSNSSSTQDLSTSPYTTPESINSSSDTTTSSNYETTTTINSSSSSDSTTMSSSSSETPFWTTESTSYSPEGNNTIDSTQVTNPLTSTVTMKTTKRPCKKKKPPKCELTEYGCCFDGITPATGPFSAGCAEISTCKETKYGCCADQVTPAQGPNNENCEEIDCQLTLFGCCPDKKSAALGNDNEGCPIPTESTTNPSSSSRGNICTGAHNESAECMTTTMTTEDFTTPDDNCTTSEFGCCQDNENIASGPNFLGCPEFGEGSGGDETTITVDYTTEFNSAQTSENDSVVTVTEDETTIVSQTSKPSTCLDSEFGCCADNKTAALGANMEGCCSTTSYGCCPDNITAATGPSFDGCGCQYSTFGCCSDGRTAAPDESRVCHCNATRYGCCQDGFQEAQGENYAGCLDISRAGEICIQPKNKGSCRDFTVKWFFDTEYGDCSRFWYGGCDGNDNRFKTQDDCRKTCVEPPGKVACFLPKITGPCDGYYPSWYYDGIRGQCLQFIYGGCLGNNNRFQNLTECETSCLQADHSPRAPRISSSEETDVTVEEGNYATLRCRASGFPTPTISWRKDGSEIDRSLDRYRFSNDGLLQIIGTYAGDSGTYTCTAENGVGRPVQLNLRLTVKPRVTESETPVTVTPPTPPTPPPPPTLTTVDMFSNRPPRIDSSYPTDIAAEEGSYATLRCSASGFPPPTIQWQRGTTIIDRSDGRYKLNDGVLQVIGLYRSDAGSYICIADNGVGQPDQKEYRLTITDNRPTTLTTPTQPTPPDVYINPNCTDNPFFANCELIVKANYCNHKYYGKFCCRSCTLGLQIPLDVNERR